MCRVNPISTSRSDDAADVVLERLGPVLGQRRDGELGDQGAHRLGGLLDDGTDPAGRAAGRLQQRPGDGQPAGRADRPRARRGRRARRTRRTASASNVGGHEVGVLEHDLQGGALDLRDRVARGRATGMRGDGRRAPARHDGAGRSVRWAAARPASCGRRRRRPAPPGARRPGRPCRASPRAAACTPGAARRRGCPRRPARRRAARRPGPRRCAGRTSARVERMTNSNSGCRPATSARTASGPCAWRSSHGSMPDWLDGDERLRGERLVLAERPQRGLLAGGVAVEREDDLPADRRARRELHAARRTPMSPISRRTMRAWSEPNAVPHVATAVADARQVHGHDVGVPLDDHDRLSRWRSPAWPGRCRRAPATSCRAGSPGCSGTWGPGPPRRAGARRSRRSSPVTSRIGHTSRPRNRS